MPEDDMLRTFNMGIGMVIVCAPEHEQPALKALADAGEPRARVHRFSGRGRRVRGLHRPAPIVTHGLRRIGVLISGRGSNLQALIDAVADGRLTAIIALVISNKPDAGGPAPRAGGRDRNARCSTTARSRHETTTIAALASELQSRGVTLVCLAGFMRLIGSRLLGAFPDAILNVHPSLLPSFPGVNAQAQALAHGVRVSGATVHLVTGELDGGPIVAQAATLSSRQTTRPRRWRRGSWSKNIASIRKPSRQSSTAAGASTGGAFALPAASPRPRNQPMRDAPRVSGIAIEVAGEERVLEQHPPKHQH